MTRELHELILICRSKLDVSGQQIRDKTGLSTSRISDWARKPLQSSYNFSPGDHEKAEKLRALMVEKGLRIAQDERTVEDTQSRGRAAQVNYESMREPEPPPAPEIIGVKAGERGDPMKVRRRMADDYAEQRDLEARKSRQVIRHAYGPVCYFIFGDIHFGSSGCDVDRAFDLVERVKRVPGGRIGFVGDLVDSYVVGKLMQVRLRMRSSIPDEWLIAEEWFKVAAPILDFSVGGNHDAWHMMISGVDQLRQITPSHVLYDRDEIKTEIRVGRHPFRFWLRHKFLGSSQWNTTHAEEKAIRMDDPYQDILISGHTHPGAMVRESVIHGERKGIIKVGAFKKIDRYQKRVGFPRNDKTDVAAIILCDDGKWIGSADYEMIIEYMHSVYGNQAA